MPASSSNGDAVSISQLRAGLTGRVIAPGDADYDEARALYYQGFDRHPAAIVLPSGAQDVARVVTLARDAGVDLAVRNGGHSSAGHGAVDGGITLDMSRMKALEIDDERHTAWAQAGLTAGEYTAAAAAYGLATGFGDTGSVGIAGITLGGGVGFLVRKHGLTIDDLLAVEVVTADGEIRHADAETHPDLFWALRGGGGNFGVVTRLQYRLHEIDRILGGMLLLPATPEVISGLVTEAEAAPEELSVIANVMVAPPMPFVPAEYHGELIVVAMLVHVGATERAQQVVDRFRALATPIVDMVQPMRYPELYQGEPPHPVAMSVRTMFVDGIDDRAVEAIVEHLRASTAPMSATQIRVLGGAMARVPADATAFAHRDRKLMINVAAGFEDPDDAAVHEAWVTGLAKELQQGPPAAYVNFLGDEGPGRVREAYPGHTWDRLTAIKRRYDPTNLFRFNQNIPPATEDQPM